MKGNGKTPHQVDVIDVTGGEPSVRTMPADHFDFHTSNLEAQAREDRIRELTAEIREMERARKRRWGMAPPRAAHARRKDRLFIVAIILGAATWGLVWYVN